MRCCRRIASQSDQTGKCYFLRLQLSSCLRARCNLPARTAFAHSPPVSFLFLCASTSAKPPAATPPHRGTIRLAGTSWVEQKTIHTLCANISIALNNTLRNRFILCYHCAVWDKSLLPLYGLQEKSAITAQSETRVCYHCTVWYKKHIRIYTYAHIHICIYAQRHLRTYACTRKRI